MPSAGLPMARLLAIVSGLTGRIASVPSLYAVDDRRAARGLGAEDLVGLVLDEAELDQLLERLVDLGQLGPGRHRDDDLVGQPPAELLGDLEAQRLGALGVERPHVDVDERPALLLARDLGGEPVDVVVGAVHRDQGVGVDGGVDLLGLLEVGRDEDHRLDARAGAGGGDGVGEVAGARAGERRGAELAGRAQRARDDAVLEGVGRVGGVVLDPQRVDAQGRGRGCGRWSSRVKPGSVLGLDSMSSGTGSSAL